MALAQVEQQYSREGGHYDPSGAREKTIVGRTLGQIDYSAGFFAVPLTSTTADAT